ncbi:unnamed protein product [Cutaneotrichosporon oleaginosum]
MSLTPHAPHANATQVTGDITLTEGRLNGDPTMPDPYVSKKPRSTMGCNAAPLPGADRRASFQQKKPPRVPGPSTLSLEVVARHPVIFLLFLSTFSFPLLSSLPRLILSSVTLTLPPATQSTIHPRPPLLISTHLLLLCTFNQAALVALSPFVWPLNRLPEFSVHAETPARTPRPVTTSGSCPTGPLVGSASVSRSPPLASITRSTGTAIRARASLRPRPRRARARQPQAPTPNLVHAPRPTIGSTETSVLTPAPPPAPGRALQPRSLASLPCILLILASISLSSRSHSSSPRHLIISVLPPSVLCIPVFLSLEQPRLLAPALNLHR